jgi:hypothetical protein
MWLAVVAGTFCSTAVLSAVRLSSAEKVPCMNRQIPQVVSLGVGYEWEAINSSPAAAEGGQTLPHGHSGEKHAIRLRDLDPIARAIAHLKHICCSSTGLLKLFMRCILERSGTNCWLRDCGEQQTQLTMRSMSTL